jgi:hypothetical protein
MELTPNREKIFIAFIGNRIGPKELLLNIYIYTKNKYCTKPVSAISDATSQTVGMIPLFCNVRANVASVK